MHTSSPSKAKSRSRKLGAVFTPDYLAEWLLQEVKSLRISPTVIVDPAAGDGALLLAGRSVFPKARLVGYEIDDASLSTLRTKGLSRKRIAKDSLKFKWNVTEKAGLIFANPPWGAQMTPQAQAEYKQVFQTAKGLFDTYDLFVEKIINELPQNGSAAIFIPDSILLPQHEKTRSLLTKQTEIQLLVRLGEGAFPGIYMGSVALIITKRKSRIGHKVRCAKVSREDLLFCKDNGACLKKLVEAKSHFIPQERFRSDSHYSWTLQVKEEELHIKAGKSVNMKILSNKRDQAWDQWFTSSRGLEIGKAGTLLECRQCRTLRSLPLSGVPLKCDLCNARNYPWNEISLISKTPTTNKTLIPLLAGEDLRRYDYKVSKWVDPSYENMDYKSELLDTERLLVRKTGIGIHSSWCPGGIATTQTIYHFKRKKNAPDHALRYAEGMLGSRVMNAIHLARSGETEWRSHPYVTQRTIKSLPLPIHTPGSRNERLAVRIAELAQELHADKANEDADFEIEYLTAQVLGGGKSLVDWSLNFLRTVTGSTHVQELCSTFKTISIGQVA